jgi:hypothetical protein
LGFGGKPIKPSGKDTSTCILRRSWQC